MIDVDPATIGEQIRRENASLRAALWRLLWDPLDSSPPARLGRCEDCGHHGCCRDPVFAGDAEIVEELRLMVPREQK